MPMSIAQRENLDYIIAAQWQAAGQGASQTCIPFVKPFILYCI